ncbi:MAG: sn-glycerol-3-phosphate ABC transporter ATP-binding protein UgpC [Chloroflexota bacterium]
MMSELKLQNVSKFFGDVQAVSNMNLTIADKEFLVLVGPSGCGKTTTLRMIAGLEEISKGDIFIDGKLINDLSPRHRNVAVVFQNYALYPHMSIYENMAYGLRRRKLDKDEIKRRIDEAANVLGITSLLKRRPTQLSGGQQQRVALGRSIVRQPAAFLFDEPLSALDAKLRVQMRAELSKLHDRLQSTIVYVTHDQVEAMTMGDRMVVMNEGLIQQVGAPKEVYNHPDNLFVASFVGSPPMNFVDCTLISEAENTYVVTESMRLPLSPAQVDKLKQKNVDQMVLGIRAEDLHAEPFPGDQGFPKVEMIVEVVEPLGFETHLFLSSGSESMIGRVSANFEPHSGDKLEILFNMNKIHLFDPKTGENLL